MKNAVLLLLAALVGVESWILWLNRDAGWIGHPLASPAAVGPDTSALAATAGQATYRSFTEKARRAQLLALATPFKMMMMEHQMMEGRFPESWADVHVDASTLASKDVAQVQLTQGEVVILPRRVPGGWLSLAPEEALGGMTIEWECRTNVEAFVDSVCRHDSRSFPLVEASFDCGRAGDAIERAICRDHELMRQDRELARELEGLRGALSQERVVRLDHEQLAFEVARAKACEGLQRAQQGVCIRERTAARIETLASAEPRKG